MEFFNGCARASCHIISQLNDHFARAYGRIGKLCANIHVVNTSVNVDIPIDSKCQQLSHVRLVCDVSLCQAPCQCHYQKLFARANKTNQCIIVLVAVHYAYG